MGNDMEQEYITVSALNSYIKRLISSDSNLKRVYVRGELSNFKRYPSGHLYFTLKDKGSEIGGVMFKGPASRLRFEPKNGMKVLVSGNVDVYAKQGNYKLYAHKITEDGIGDLYIAYEQLKKELSQLGWFDEDHKNEIPRFPKRVGVVTASTGAAIRDIVTTIKRRWPLCEIILFPSLVQGNLAPNNIIKQIILADTQFNLDTLIIGRGGGSIEDLWAFNDKTLAKVIYHTKTPIISAVGHEIDWTISDYVADLRAATPTAAAELAVPDIKEIKSNLDNLDYRINKQVSNQLSDNKESFDKLISRNLFKDPAVIYNKKFMNLDNLRGRLAVCSKNMIFDNKIRLSRVKSSAIFKNPRRLYESKMNNYNQMRYRLKFSGDGLIGKKEARLIKSKNSFIFKNPEKLFESKANRYFNLRVNLQYSSMELLRDKKYGLNEIKKSNVIKNPESILEPNEIRLDKYIDKLSVLNPLNTLRRGYTVSRVDGKVVSKANDLNKDDLLEVEFEDGAVNTRVL